jgi:hypothetical protein
MASLIAAAIRWAGHIDLDQFASRHRSRTSVGGIAEAIPRKFRQWFDADPLQTLVFEARRRWRFAFGATTIRRTRGLVKMSGRGIWWKD